jgi:hypothetical protein
MQVEFIEEVLFDEGDGRGHARAIVDHAVRDDNAGEADSGRARASRFSERTAKRPPPTEDAAKNAKKSGRVRRPAADSAATGMRRKRPSRRTMMTRALPAFPIPCRPEAATKDTTTPAVDQEMLLTWNTQAANAVRRHRSIDSSSSFRFPAPQAVEVMNMQALPTA